MELSKFKEPGLLPVDRIIAYLESPTETDEDITQILSDKDIEIYDQINFADDQIRINNRSPKSVVNLMRKKFTNSRTGKPISIDTCYRRIREAQRVFGSVGKQTKDYWRGVLTDILLANIRRAAADNDVRGINAASAILERVLALGKDEAGGIPADALTAIVVIHQPDPRVTGITPVPQQEVDEWYHQYTGEKPLPTIDVDVEIIPDGPTD